MTITLDITQFFQAFGIGFTITATIGLVSIVIRELLSLIRNG